MQAEAPLIVLVVVGLSVAPVGVPRVHLLHGAVPHEGALLGQVGGAEPVGLAPREDGLDGRLRAKTPFVAKFIWVLTTVFRLLVRTSLKTCSETCH